MSVDEGNSLLLCLKDNMDGIIENRSESPVTPQVNTEVGISTSTLLHSLSTDRATVSTNTNNGSMLTETTCVNTDTHGTVQADTAAVNTDIHEPDMQRLLASYDELYHKSLQFNV